MTNLGVEGGRPRASREVAVTGPAESKKDLCNILGQDTVLTDLKNKQPRDKMFCQAQSPPVVKFDLATT